MSPGRPSLPGSCLPPALAQWYRQAHAAALSLNHQEMAARHELRLAERCQVKPPWRVNPMNGLVWERDEAGN
jgi:hypothetical protein